MKNRMTTETENAVNETINSYRQHYALSDDQVQEAADNTGSFPTPAPEDTAAWVDIYAACLGGTAEAETTHVWVHRDGSAVAYKDLGRISLNKNGESGTYPGKLPCMRCGGSGVYRWHTSFGPASGACFGCGGIGYRAKDVAVYTPEKIKKLNAAQARREAKRRADMEAQARAQRERADMLRAGTLELYGEIIDAAESAAPDFLILQSMLGRFTDTGKLSPRQATWIDKILADHYVETAKRAQSRHVGAVGERIEITATIERVIPIDTQYGTSYITILRDDAGNAYKQFGAFIANTDARVSGKATIKDHEVYKGEDLTRIQRPKFQEV